MIDFKGSKIGIIGAGNMGGALIKGIAKADIFKAENIYITDNSQEKIQSFMNEFGIIKNSVESIAYQCDYIIVAVKPNVTKELLAKIKEYFHENNPIIISIVAGLSTESIGKIIGDDRKIVRVMPNTPAQVGEGMSGVCGGGKATQEDIEAVRDIFSCVGRAVIVSEDKMDAVTGVAGSSPAFIFQVIEAMSDAGVRAGLKREEAIEMAAQTVLGAAKMVLETKKHPAELKDMVTSPSGTTIEGVYMIEKGGVRSAFIKAVSAVVAKSKEMNNK